MKHIYLISGLLFLFHLGFTQTNIFPASGNVGIGTASPSSFLEIYNSTPKFTLTPASYGGAYRSTFGTGGGAEAFLIFGNNGRNEIRAGNTNPGGFLDFFTNNSASQENISDGNFVMRLAANGSVGIGTTTPNSKLAVNGDIRAKEVKVENANWPDYVFAKSYELPSLQTIEQHIKEKGHLPGIPSAEEVKANGVDLGEMNAKLLQKIEELTLYLIDIKKENDNRNKKLRAEIDFLKSKNK